MFNFISKQDYVYKYYNDIRNIIEKIDYWMPSMAAEHLFGYTNYNQIPTEPHIFYKHNNNLYSDKIKVGVKFRGSEYFEMDRHRSPKIVDIIKTLHPFKDIIEFHSLEKDYIDLPNWIIKHNIEDFCDTANIIQQMKFNISTCTSIAHLSAGLGKKTIIMIPILPYWLWAYEREDRGSWYYSDTILLRQKKFGNWENVLNELKKEIEKEII